MHRIDEPEAENSGKEQLGNSKLILTLGIIALISIIFYSPVSFVLAAITLVLAYTEHNNYTANRQLYSRSSYVTTRTGAFCAIIALVLFLIILILSLLNLHYMLDKIPVINILDNHIYF